MMRRARYGLWSCLIAMVLAACSGGSAPGDVVAPPGAGPIEPRALRLAANAANFYWGAAATAGREDALGMPAYDAALAGQFNMLTAENELKFDALRGHDGQYHFEAADRLAEFARAHGMKMRGHVLIWREDPSEWLGADTSREAAIALMREHIFTVLGYYRQNYADVFVHWDVVNEAFRADGTLRDSGWRRLIGDDFIELAFRFADEAWPELTLYYNDFFEQNAVMFGVIDAYGNFDPDSLRLGLGTLGPLSVCEASSKCMAVRAMAEDFIARGVPIDGIGFQGHIANVVDPNYAAFTSWVSDLGLEWAITELDNPCISGPTGALVDPAVCFENQARVFGAVVRDCIVSPACNTVVQWGVADPYSWWPRITAGQLDRPLALDDGFALKPAGQAVLDELLQHP